MRFDDWHERLTDAILAARDQAFAYGVHDCFLMVADCALAITGRDIAEGLRGRYETIEAGLKLGRVRSLAEKMRKHFKRVPLALAHRGDIAMAPVGVLRRGKREQILFVVDGVWLRGAGGMQVPRSEATHAWRVE